MKPQLNTEKHHLFCQIKYLVVLIGFAGHNNDLVGSKKNNRKPIVNCKHRNIV